MTMIVGIDLGTSAARIGVYENSDLKLLKNSVGEYSTPSVVAFAADGQILVGQDALDQSSNDEYTLIYDASRFIGRKYSSLTSNEKAECYQIVALPNDDIAYHLNIKGSIALVSPTQIYAIILDYLIECAEEEVCIYTKEAILTIPASTTIAQRQAIMEAAKSVEVKIRRMITGTASTAFAYSYKNINSEKIAICDLGESHLSVAVFEIGDGVIEAKAQRGTCQLGGKTFDEALINWVLEQFKAIEKIDLSKDKSALILIRKACQEAKIMLSSTIQHHIFIPSIITSNHKAIDLSVRITRNQFNEITKHIINAAGAVIRDCLSAAFRNDYYFLDKIVLTGAASKIPAFEKLCLKTFDLHSLTRLDTEYTNTLGAVLLAGILRGDVGDLLLLDITTHTISMRYGAGDAIPLIDIDCTISVRKSHCISRNSDSAVDDRICIYEEGNTLNENNLIGELTIPSISQIDADEECIEIIIDIGFNYSLTISVKNLKTDETSHITI